MVAGSATSAASIPGETASTISTSAAAAPSAPFIPRWVELYGWCDFADRDDLFLTPSETCVVTKAILAALEDDYKKHFDIDKLERSNNFEINTKIIFPFKAEVSIVDRGGVSSKTKQLYADGIISAIGTSPKHRQAKVRLEVKPEQKPINVSVAKMMQVFKNEGLKEPDIKYQRLTVMLMKGQARPIKLACNEDFAEMIVTVLARRHGSLAVLCFQECSWPQGFVIQGYTFFRPEGCPSAILIPSSLSGNIAWTGVVGVHALVLLHELGVASSYFPDIAKPDSDYDIASQDFKRACALLRSKGATYLATAGDFQVGLPPFIDGSHGLTGPDAVGHSAGSAKCDMLIEVISAVKLKAANTWDTGGAGLQTRARQRQPKDSVHQIDYIFTSPSLDTASGEPVRDTFDHWPVWCAIRHGTKLRRSSFKWNFKGWTPTTDRGIDAYNQALLGDLDLGPSQISGSVGYSGSLHARF